jgi:hypothetical protein
VKSTTKTIYYSIPFPISKNNPPPLLLSSITLGLLESRESEMTWELGVYLYPQNYISSFSSPPPQRKVTVYRKAMAETKRKSVMVRWLPSVARPLLRLPSFISLQPILPAQQSENWSQASSIHSPSPRI